MTREEWKAAFEANTIDGNPIHNAANKAARNASLRKLAEKERLLYGIGKWIYQKACDGEEWALEAYEYQVFDRYDMVIKKAKEEGKIT
jgi:hypothetical protein